MGVTMKTKHVVKPAQPTWHGILPLSELDQIGDILHTYFLYIYNKPSHDSPHQSSNFSEIINILMDSLSRALVHYYPLAGRLRWISGGRLEVECNAMGVEFIEAESSYSISDFGDLSSLKGEFKDLIPCMDYEKCIQELPVYAVQVTRFKCGGYAIVSGVAHALVDGLESFNFYREWAKLTRGDQTVLEATTPHLDRRVLQYRGRENKISQFDPHVFFSPTPTLMDKTNKCGEEAKETIANMLSLTKSQLDKLKKAANCDIENGSNGRPYSRFDALAGHIWRSACKAREHQSEQMTALCFSVDTRGRMDPPLPSRYFGNAIIDVKACIAVEELVSSPLSHACQRIREAKEKITNDSVTSLIDFLKGQKDLSKYQGRDKLGSTEGVHYGNPNIQVVSLSNIPVRGVDFGWGKEVFVSPATHEFDGDILILPGHNDDGSVVVFVGLQVDHMEKFKKFLYEDILVPISRPPVS